MPDIQITPCNFENPEHTRALVDLMNAYVNDKMGGGLPFSGERANQLIEGLKSTPNSLVLLARLNNTFVGLCNSFITFATFTVKKCINVHDVIVADEFRGQGIGEKLLQQVIKIANDLDCSKITLEVREDNEIAQRLYKKLGFSDCDPRMFFWVKMLS